MVKFNLYNVTDDQGHKARVFYSTCTPPKGKPYVTLYAKNYGESLAFLPRCENDSDVMTDYFEKDRVRIYEGDELYAAALAAAERKSRRDKEKIDIARLQALAGSRA